MKDRAYHVLFLCTGNSARSIMAEAVLNRAGSPHFRAWSAGSHPKGAVHPHALSVLRSRGYDTGALYSKSWDEFSAPGAPVFDFIFTVCDAAASETCPVWPGHPMTAHWGIPDPAAVKGAEAEVSLAFEKACDQLESRIDRLLSLPLERLSGTGLHECLRAIGAGGGVCR